MSSEDIVRLIWITAAWARVNDSIAPKAYRFPRNWVDPLGIISNTAITLKKMMATYGVLYLGCTRLMIGGSWRCSPIE